MARPARVKRRVPRQPEILIASYRTVFPARQLQGRSAQFGGEFTRAAIPDPQNAILAAGDDDVAVGRSRGGVKKRRGTLKLTNRFALVIQHTDVVVAGGGQEMVGGEAGDRGNFLFKTINVLASLPGAGVPNLDDRIGAGRRECPAILLPGYSQDMVGVAFERFGDLASAQVELPA